MPIQSFIRTLRSQSLGQHLRGLREQRGLSLKLVAEHLDRDASALARYETAEWPIPRADVVKLLDLYGIHEATSRDPILKAAENIWRTHSWRLESDNDPDMPSISLPWLTMRAERLCLFHPNIVPEPLQTPQYSDLTLRFTQPSSESARLVEQRRDIQRALAVTETKIEAIVDESALHRAIGGVEILRAQLLHLRDLQQSNQAEIRVLPTDVALHSGLGGPFWLFEMPHPYPTIGYLDGLAGQLYVELPQAERLVDTYLQLTDATLGIHESTAEIDARIAELA